MFKKLLITLIMLLIPTGATLAADNIKLPPPDKEGGMPLMAALNARKTNRAIKPEALPESEISNLAWAAWGINRADGKRTTPTARNEQKVQLYVALESGVWLYKAESHELQQVMSQDLRGNFGGAPLTLIYAAIADSEYSAMHVGSMYQNTGLYCASAGLANVVKGSGLKTLEDLPLPAGYKVFIAHPIGRPK
ncbi:MAG: nitroreductase family protein [Desulfovibrionaceae bacterium]|nr:nitroreductase family protein [Desulfovibrionaceae bacterium]